MSKPRQSGVSLVFALIVLVLMAISGVALIRSMDTTNLIAGNMAFQQSAVHSSDAGVEAAIGWLALGNDASGVLYSNVPSAGYSASAGSVPANALGEDFWNALAPAGFAICRWPAAPVQPRPVCPTQQATASRSWSSACAARPVRPWEATAQQALP